MHAKNTTYLKKTCRKHTRCTPKHATSGKLDKNMDYTHAKNAKCMLDAETQ